MGEKAFSTFQSPKIIITIGPLYIFLQKYGVILFGSLKTYTTTINLKLIIDSATIVNPICHGLLGPDGFMGGFQSARTQFNPQF